jgi:hypothetical protein
MKHVTIVMTSPTRFYEFWVYKVRDRSQSAPLFKMDPQGQAAVQFLQSVVSMSGAGQPQDVSITDSTLPTLESAHVFAGPQPGLPAPTGYPDEWENVRAPTASNSPASTDSYSSCRNNTLQPGWHPMHPYPFEPAAYAPQGYHNQNQTFYKASTPQTVMLAPETAELLKTAISSDLQVKLNIQLSLIQQSILSEVREEFRKLLNEIKEEVRTLKRRKRG